MKKMNQKIQIKEVVVVEGRYDKIKLSSLIDGVIIETDGFRIFKDTQKLKMLRDLANKNGLIILTDSDRAGYKIRSYLVGAIPPDKVKNIYIPDVYGKERRKNTPSKEGKLGVEGINASVLRGILEKNGVGTEQKLAEYNEITRITLYEYGLSGSPESASLRKAVLKKLNLPENLSSKRMTEVLNRILGYDGFVKMMEGFGQFGIL